eukprot:gnl/TRDRNA2_/TRDRNA2_82626_c0_seq1.p1 gnl/TRDRNA2_/TRDRNA2_82626_c0~~gnl/TRDRNA2_/TRDRNA2_82626_c0_seq1.p1  ORF type:complete len:112 (-),score=24.59 gnl/TRDRNA2_/TRDRNA2_82626_c0_seq1:59-394(-)
MVHGSYQQARQRLAEFGQRAMLHYTTSKAAASAIPQEALDMVLIDAAGEYLEVSQDLKWWQARVKPGGILAGHGFVPDSGGGLRAVCDWRFSNEIHLGMAGTFWWYVEPEE